MEAEIWELASLFDQRKLTREYPDEVPIGVLSKGGDNGKCCHTCECYFDNKSGHCCI